MRKSYQAAVLAAAMNLVPAAPVDILRFLRVPAIVLTLRRVRARVCNDERHRPRRRRSRVTSAS
jgi:hypothetical protein